MPALGPITHRRNLMTISGLTERPVPDFKIVGSVLSRVEDCDVGQDMAIVNDDPITVSLVLFMCAPAFWVAVWIDGVCMSCTFEGNHPFICFDNSLPRAAARLSSEDETMPTKLSRL